MSLLGAYLTGPEPYSTMCTLYYCVQLVNECVFIQFGPPQHSLVLYCMAAYDGDGSCDPTDTKE